MPEATPLEMTSLRLEERICLFVVCEVPDAELEFPTLKCLVEMKDLVSRGRQRMGTEPCLLMITTTGSEKAC